jgi:ribonuclease Z
LKASGLAVGGLALADKLALADEPSNPLDTCPSNCNTLFDSLKPCYPQQETLATDEMRITFLGTWYCPRLAQESNSIFVELGNGDSFVFDCGSGVMGKYNALGVPLSRMNKIFLTHIHADHMTDLTHIYCFGPAYDRKTPLYIWGPTKSGVPDPVTGQIYNDGTKDYCQLLREAVRWHTESFSFQSTAYVDYDYPTWKVPGGTPPQVKDAYDLVPFECDWKTEGFIAYEYNGVRITSFPSVHARQGSIGYKLEWTVKERGRDRDDDARKPDVLSMIFTGDTKPNNYVIRQATNGVDVLIHEITTSPQVWTEKFTGIAPTDEPAFDNAVAALQRVIDSSHTPEKAFGYILSQLKVAPRLAVGTHFPATDDTISEAFGAIRTWYPRGEVTIASDFVVLNVTKERIRQRRAVVSDYSWATISKAVSEAPPGTFEVPKYQLNGVGNPYAQLDPNADVIPASVYNAK